MNHSNRNRKFGREKAQRKSLIVGLCLNLIKHEKIKTSLAKAKEIRSFVERIVTLAKVDSVARRRLIMSRLLNRELETKKLFSKISPKYKDVNGGYLRVLKLNQRLSDGADMAIIEFV